MAPRSSSPSPARPPLPRRTLWLIAAAFGIGLLLFGLFLLDQRDNTQFFRAPVATDKPAFEPLPVPNEPDATQVGDAVVPAPVIDVPPPVLPAPAPAPSPPPRPAPIAATPAPPASAPASANVRDGAPRPLSTPQPRYPPVAARNGEGGDVLLRLHVDANGEVEDVDLVSGSGSRELDRAAIQAVRRWTFQPAMRNGQPVPGEVKVPIRFTPPTD